LLVGYYGMDNLGDEAIRAEIERAAARLGVSIWRIATRRPVPDGRAVWLTPRGLRAYLAAIRDADRVVIGGGGILKDEGLRLPLDLAFTCLAARLLRRPVTLVGVGVGPLYTRIGRWLVRNVAASARYRSVRDEASAVLLGSMGIADVEVGADPVFAAEPPPASSSASSSAQGGVPIRGAGPAADGLAQGGVPIRGAGPGADGLARHDRPAHRPPTMLVCLRTWFHRDADGGIARQAALLDAIAVSLTPYASAGWRFDIVPLYHPRDIVPGRDLAARLPPGSVVKVTAVAIDWTALLDRLATVDLVLTMRFHALAAALIEDRPAVALAYEPKVTALAVRTGTPVVPVDDPTLANALTLALDAALQPLEPVAAARREIAVRDMRRAAEQIVERALAGELRGA